MARTHVATVGGVLHEYADRGVFGGFSEEEVRGGRTEFVFMWLYRRRYCVVFDERACTLTFKDVLPHFPIDSAMYGALKAFVKSRSDAGLRAHRRIDRGRAEAKCVNRGGCVSISVKVKRNQYTYGVRKLVTLVHEVFNMIDQEFTEYLYEHFDLPEE